MAETTVFPGPQAAETAAPPPAPKKSSANPPGRPRKDGLPPGTEVGAPITSEGDFFIALTGFDQKEWDYLILYLFRCKPITDRQSKGEPKYISKYGEPIDIDRVMRDHGSGYYQIKLVQVGAGGRGAKEISRCYFDIMNMDHPPKVPPGDWVEDARNRDWEWCRAKLGPQAAATVQQGVSPTELVDTMLKFKAATDRPEPRESSADLIATILNSPVIAAFVKPAPPPVAVEPKEDPAQKRLMDMLIDDRKTMREKLDRLEEKLMEGAKAAPPKDILDSLLESREKLDALKTLFGKGGGTPAPEGWAGIADKAIDKFAGPLGQIGLILTQRAMMPNAPAAQPGAARPPITIHPTPAQPAAPPQAQPEPQAATAVAGVPPDQLAAVQKHLHIIQQCIPFLIDQFKDSDGYAFRDWFCSPKRWGRMLNAEGECQAWADLRNDIGVDGFIQLLKIFPAEQGGDQIRAELSPEDRFREFMTQFFSDDDPEDFQQGGQNDDEEFTRPPA